MQNYTQTGLERVAPLRAAIRARRLNAGQLGALDPKTGYYISNILVKTFPAIYSPGSQDWLKQFSPLKIADIVEIVKAAMYYYGLGYPIKPVNGAFAFRKSLQQSLPKFNPLLITKVLSFLAGIDPAKYPLDVYFLKTGKIDSSAAKLQAENLNTEAIENLKYEATDKAQRGAAAIVTAAQDTGKFLENTLPWYLKPKVIIPMGLGAVALMYLAQAKGLFDTFTWKKNPIEPSKRERAKKAYKVFHNAEPKKVKSIPHIDCEELAELGDALQIGYRSKKWTGKKENYLHEFGKGVKVMCTPDRKTIVIHGGNMSIEDVGIVN